MIDSKYLVKPGGKFRLEDFKADDTGDFKDRQDAEYESRKKLDKLHDISKLVHKFSGTQASEHKPIVGKWTFTHESGIHVAGLLANPETYQPFPPHLIGRHHEIVFGKHSGVQGVGRLAELSGLTLSEPARKAVLDRIKKDAAENRRTVPEATILEWIREEMGSAVPA